MSRKKKKMRPKIKEKLDMSYGRNVTLYCFVERSHHSDAHAVYLEINRGKETQHRLISAHANIVDALKLSARGTKILENLTYDYKQTNDAITQAFIHNLVETYGDYTSDDAEYKPCGNSRILVPWLMAGGSMNDKHIPEGITFEVIKPPVTKKWKIFNHPHSEPNFPQGIYAVGISEFEVLMIENSEDVIVCNLYFPMAYLADYLNNKDYSGRYLPRSEVDRIYSEALQIFSMLKEESTRNN
jgi:hypothetical protein